MRSDELELKFAYDIVSGAGRRLHTVEDDCGELARPFAAAAEDREAAPQWRTHPGKICSQRLEPSLGLVR